MTAVPGTVARIADLMSTFRPTWALCGGWAVDAWLGRETREHGDIDISVFDDNQGDIFDHLIGGWQLIAHDPTVPGDTKEPWNGRPLEHPAHIHALDDDGLKLEVLVDERSGGDWILRREPRVTLSLRRCVQQSAWGLPTVVPEVLAVYKATAYIGIPELEARPHDKADVLALLPQLTDKQRSWLRDAIARVHPGHRWLTELSL